MSTPARAPAAAPPGRSRRASRAAAHARLVTAAAAVVALDMSTKAVARFALPGNTATLGPFELRLGFNPGLAFGVGADSPRWLVLAATGLIVAVLVLAAVKLRPAGAAALIVGGGLANVLDRAGDGTVTDFLGVGWWPTFNLADSAICAGSAWFIIASLRGRQMLLRDADADAPGPGARHGP